MCVCERERERSFPREQATRRFPGSGVPGVSSRKRFNRTSRHRRLRERWGAELARHGEGTTGVKSVRRKRDVCQERAASSQQESRAHRRRAFRCIFPNDRRPTKLSLSLSLSIASNPPLSRGAILRQQRQRAAYVTLHLHNAAANCQCSLRFENKICAAVPRRNGRVYEHTPASRPRLQVSPRGGQGRGKNETSASTWKPAGSVGGNWRPREGA